MFLIKNMSRNKIISISITTIEGTDYTVDINSILYHVKRIKDSTLITSINDNVSCLARTEEMAYRELFQYGQAIFQLIEDQKNQLNDTSFEVTPMNDTSREINNKIYTFRLERLSITIEDASFEINPQSYEEDDEIKFEILNVHGTRPSQPYELKKIPIFRSDNTTINRVSIQSRELDEYRISYYYRNKIVETVYDIFPSNN